MSSQGNYTTLEMEEKKSKQKKSDLELPFDDEFWTKVNNKFQEDGKSWNRAMDEVRVERLKAAHDRGDPDPLLVIIRDWPDDEKYKDEKDLLASLEYLISRFTEILLEQDNGETYKYFRDESDDTRPTLLHLAADKGFIHVVTHLVNKYPGMVYLKTKVSGDQRKYLPLEMALKSYKDETAAFLISHMKPDWVHKLFLYDNKLQCAKFSLGKYISHKSDVTNKTDMNKTVVAILDSLINPHWPYLPEISTESKEHEDDIYRAWASVPDDPLNYDFFYHVLECDSEGREPLYGGVRNEYFDKKSKSCVWYLTLSDNKEAIQHPVIRMLVMEKWNNYAHWYFRIQAVCYLVFLLLLSYALIYGATRDDPKIYDGSANILRLVCEWFSIILIVVYMFEELCQLSREPQIYFKDIYNLFDWSGLILTLLVIPLRYADVSAEWSVASLGYLFNFLRIFKFSCVTRTTGLYTKTLAKIIRQDIGRFLFLFFFVCVGFCGSLFLALTAAGKGNRYSNYGELMLAAVRVLTEQQPIEEDYGKFNWFTILILLGYMAVVIVVLLNILIAQLSFTYSEAKNNAKLQYAIDRMSIISRIEQSIYGMHLRVKYYKDGDKVSEDKLAEEMLEYSDERHPWESMDEKLTQLRDMMKKVVQRC